MKQALDGVILAAGRSRRMGRPKGALPVGGETFVQRALRLLRGAGCRRVYLVTAADGSGSQDACEAADVERVINPAAESEQVDSLRLVVRRVPPETGALLVLPVDLPLVMPATAAAVAETWRQHSPPLCVPVHAGVAGHPVLIGRPLFQELLEDTLPEGVRTLLARHAARVREVPVQDVGIHLDIDTPADYRQHVGSW
jgi:molybdenum cofactor cytidylyltransferase